jgi:hypothetical protein
MANPTAQAVHIDQTLTNYAVGIFQDPANLMGAVFPMIPVDKQSNKYLVWDRGDALRDNLQIRPPATESAGTEFNVSTDNYYADVFALHIDKPDQVAANADFDYDARVTATLVGNLQQHLEQQQIAQLISSGKWGTDQAGVASLSPTANQVTQFNFAGADPGKTIDTLNDGILGTMGRRGNTLVLGSTAYTELKRSVAVKDQLKYTQSATPTEADVAKYLGVDRLIVARGIKATSNKGQTLTTGFTFGAKDGWLGYIDPSMDMETATAASIFVWTGLDGSTLDVASPNIYQFAINEKRVIRYEIQIAYDMKIQSTALGKFLLGIVA